MSRRALADRLLPVAGALGRRVVALQAKAIGAPRLAAWAVASSSEPFAAPLAVEEISSLRDLEPADVVGGYLQGHLLMGRGGDTKPEVLLHYVAPRGVIDATTARIPKTVAYERRKSDLRVAHGVALEPVLRATQQREKTWIVEPLVEPWLAVERAGFAHAVAAFRGDEMVAGLWGLAIGRTFGIMSMVHHEKSAGSHVLAAVVDQIGPEGRWDLVDCGSLNANFVRYGAYDVSVPEFTARVLRSMSAGPRPSDPAAPAS